MTQIDILRMNARVQVAGIDSRGRCYFTARDGVHRMLIAPSATLPAPDRIALLNVAESYQQAVALAEKGN